MLWAAWGINRPDGRRTAASAMNCQEIDLYLIGKQGAALKKVGTEARKDIETFFGKIEGNAFEYLIFIARTGIERLFYILYLDLDHYFDPLLRLLRID